MNILKKMFLLLFLLVGITSLSFAASDWQFITNSDEKVYGVDINSVGQVSEFPYQKYKKAWIKSVIQSDLTKDGMTIGDYSMMLYWADCNAKTIGLKTITHYKNNGKVVSDKGFSNAYVQMKDVIPETIGEGILDGICGSTKYP